MTNLETYASKFLPNSITDTKLFAGFRSCDTHADRMNGRAVANWLESIGETVVSHRDTGRNGEAVTASGFSVSTNGYVCKIS